MSKSNQTTLPGVPDIEITLWRVNLSHLAIGGDIRSVGLGVEAAGSEHARQRALELANNKGWLQPRITSVKPY